MTTVYLEHDGGTFAIHARGHATGSTEVCAAISCLMYTVAGWLRNRPEIGGIHRLEDGDASIVFFDREAAARTAFELAQIGFLQLASTYPDYIRVEGAEKK